MASQLVTQARELTRRVTSAMQEHARPAATSLDAARAAANKRPLGLAATLEVSQEDLDASFKALEERDATLQREVGEDQDARDARDTIQARLFGRVSATSRGVYQLYGLEGLKRLHLHGSTPTAPGRLVAFARGFVTAARPLPRLPDPSDEFQTINLDGARDAIDADTTLLDDSITALTQETRETQLARSARDAALEAWRRDLDLALTLTRSTLEYNGQHDLADRILPSTTSAIQLTPTEQPNPGGTPPQS